MVKWKVGDKVTVGGHYSIDTITTIERLTERKMVLADGSEWTANGARRWGNASDIWTLTGVRPYRAGDDEKFERQEALKAIKEARFGELTTNQLRRIRAIIDEKTDD